jgi:3' terminal RNA ribose 2'-O-methyltransferase Hen1
MRLAAVMKVLIANDVHSVLDLGCGDGELLIRLAQHPAFERLSGIDISPVAIAQARDALHQVCDAREKQIELEVASFTASDSRLKGFDPAVLLETLEHIEPLHLRSVESAVFGCYRPLNVIITTPNQEYNVLHGMPPCALRHPDHRFEWDRQTFQTWSCGVAARNGYTASFDNIGPVHETMGASTQMAIFKRWKN